MRGYIQVYIMEMDVKYFYWWSSDNHNKRSPTPTKTWTYIIKFQQQNEMFTYDLLSRIEILTPTRNDHYNGYCQPALNLKEHYIYYYTKDIFLSQTIGQ